MKTVLVVDDERQIAEIARDYLRHAGFAVITAADGAAALAMARAERPDLIVLDLALPRVDGLDVARTLRRESSVLGQMLRLYQVLRWRRPMWCRFVQAPRRSRRRRRP